MGKIKPTIFTRIIQRSDGKTSSKDSKDVSKEIKDIVVRHSNDTITMSSILDAYQIGKTEQTKFTESIVGKKGDGRGGWRSVLITIVVIGSCLYILPSLFSGSVSIGKMMIDNLTFKPVTSDVKFKDVCGCDNPKKELEDIVTFLTSPESFNSLGARLPKGVLLVGPPGVGKTLLAKAVAGEAKVPFIQCSGSHFDEMFVGTGAARVRKLFQEAKSHAPCVVFIDEFDSVGGKRVTSSVQPYANQTVNQLLAEMDGFDSSDGVIVLAATNRMEHLDKAILRPGRFDVHVQVPLPDMDGRRDLFSHYLDKIKYDPNDVDIDRLAKLTIGNTGADINNIVNQAAIIAGTEGDIIVDWSHMQRAFDKVVMGIQGNRIKLEKVLKNTAAHEAGHAIIAYFTKHAQKVNQVTILPRGQSLGHTGLLPDEEHQYGMSKVQILAKIDTLMGGRLGEELLEGPDGVTTGASNDFQQATALATSMVYNLGMSDIFGIRTVSKDPNQLFDDVSPELRRLADEEVKKILDESLERSRKLLLAHKKEFQLLMDALLAHESLTSDDMERVLKGLKPLTASEKQTNKEGQNKEHALGLFDAFRSRIFTPLGPPSSSDTNRVPKSDP